MGEFGEGKGHAGLSSYKIGTVLWKDIKKLDKKMGAYGDSPLYVTIFEGEDVGMGPESEDLVRPSKIISSRPFRQACSLREMIGLIYNDVAISRGGPKIPKEVIPAIGNAAKYVEKSKLSK